MAIRLVIDGNSVYEVDEDWEIIYANRNVRDKYSNSSVPEIIRDKEQRDQKEG